MCSCFSRLLFSSLCPASFVIWLRKLELLVHNNKNAFPCCSLVVFSDASVCLKNITSPEMGKGKELIISKLNWTKTLQHKFIYNSNVFVVREVQWKLWAGDCYENICAFSNMRTKEQQNNNNNRTTWKSQKSAGYAAAPFSGPLCKWDLFTRFIVQELKVCASVCVCNDILQCVWFVLSRTGKWPV